MVSVFRIAKETDRLKNSCLRDAGCENGASLIHGDAYEKQLPSPVHWFADHQWFYFSVRIRNLHTGELFKYYFFYEEGYPCDVRSDVIALEGVDPIKTVYFFDPLYKLDKLKDLLSGKKVILTTGTHREFRSFDPYVLDL